MHVEYTEIFREYVKEGDFNLSELTRYFHSLCKLGEDHRMVRSMKKSRDSFRGSRCQEQLLLLLDMILLTDDFVEEIEIAVSMDPKIQKFPYLCVNPSTLSKESILHIIFFQNIST